MKKKNLKSLELNKQPISKLNLTELNRLIGGSGDICQTVPRMSACNGPCKSANCEIKTVNDSDYCTSLDTI